MAFIRTKEDFECGHCGKSIVGNGYTNHCPYCLWSRHVDIDPGDRAAECRGLMKPIRVETARDGYILTHRCVVCGYEKRNRTAAEDNFEAVLAIARSRDTMPV